MQRPYKPSPTDVQAEVGYMANTRQTLIVEYYGPDFQFLRHTGTEHRQRMTIRDGRGKARHWSLDKSGFELIRHRIAVRDFFDAEEVRAVYYPELERLIARACGAYRVIVYHHTVRSGDEAERAARQLLGPARFAHADYTDDSGPRLARAVLGAAADRTLHGRYAIVQAWQPTNRPALAHPLAVADARSVAVEDMLGAELRLPDRVVRTYCLRYNPRHDWFYFPEMQPDEALLFKAYESLTDGRARRAFHTSFENPLSPRNAPPRQSIESRALALFAR